MIGLFLVAACTTVCKGPGCESDYPASRVAVHRGGAELLDTSPAWASEAAFFDGTDSDGVSWSVQGLKGQLVIAQPEANRVVLVDDRSDQGAVDPVASWVWSDARFGASMAIARHNRDDGWDLWVGGPDNDLGTGAVWFFDEAQVNQAGAEGLSASAATLRINGSSAADQFGTLIAVCGDMTGDNRPEVAVTAPWLEETVDDCSDPGEQPTPGQERICALAGAVFLLQSELLVNATTDDPWELGVAYLGSNEGDGAGTTVVCDRDLTGDGVPDLAIGAPWYGSTAGRVYVIEGGDSMVGGALDDVADRIIDPPNSKKEHWFGMSLATLDLFGDGAADLVVGSPGYSGGQGRVLIYRGASIINAFSPAPFRQIRGEASRSEIDHLGRWLATGSIYAGVRDDLIIGAPDYLGAQSNGFDTGRAWVFRGDNAENWSSVVQTDESTAEFRGEHAFQRVGRRPAIFDVDEDGLGDILLPTQAAFDE